MFIIEAATPRLCLNSFTGRRRFFFKLLLVLLFCYRFLLYCDIKCVEWKVDFFSTFHLHFTLSLKGCVTWTECASILIFFPALGYLIISRMEIWHPRINCDSCSTSAVTFTLQLVCLQSCSTAAVVEWRSWYVSSKEYNLIVFWAVKGNTIFNTTQTSI